MTLPNYNLIRLVRNSIDQLKREYGGEITLCRLDTSGTDLESGNKTETHTTVYIKRAVVLPVNVRREVIQSISMVSANKHLAYGGSFEDGQRVFLIDRRDAPGITLTNDDWIVYNKVRYNIKSIDEYEQGTGWIVTAKYVAGTPDDDDQSKGVANYNLIRLVRQAVNRLKKDYGGAITVYQLGSATTNLATGVKSHTRTSVYIPRAIVLPVNVRREVIQSVAVMSANKKMVMGGFFDAGLRMFIIDRRDAPSVTLTTDDWVVYNHVRYNIKSVDEFEQNTAWVVTGKALQGTPPEEDFYSRGGDLLEFTQLAAGVAVQHEPRAYGDDSLTLIQNATVTT